MITHIIDWSLRNRFMVILLTVILTGWGIYAVKNTPLDAIPDLSDVQVIIFTEYQDTRLWLENRLMELLDDLDPEEHSELLPIPWTVSGMI